MFTTAINLVAPVAVLLLAPTTAVAAHGNPPVIAARHAPAGNTVVLIARGGSGGGGERGGRPASDYLPNIRRHPVPVPVPFPGDDANRVHIGINDSPSNSNEAPEIVDPQIVTVSPTITTTTTTAAAAAIMSSTATTEIATGSPTSATDNPTECRLLGSFAILVQLALGGLALLSLVYKRWRERPQRPVKIWFFDVSKQVFGSVLVHAANVFMSLLTSGRFSIRAGPEVVAGGGYRLVRRGMDLVLTGMGMVGLEVASSGGGSSGLGGLLRRGDSEPYVPNPCSFYLLNLGIDTTLGIPILIVIVRLTTKLVSYTPLGRPVESIQSGNYGDPPNAWWWFKQSIIYFCGLMGMKLCVLVIFMMFPWISRVGDWALGWTEGNEKLQIVFVMMLFPLIMNAMQYYIIDSYIKKQIGGSEAGGDTDDEDEGGSERGSVGSGTAVAGGHGGVSYGVISASDSDDSSDEIGEEDSIKKKGRRGSERGQGRGQRVHLARRDSSKSREYDPTIDGDTGTVVGSSSSRASDTRGLLLTKELGSS